MAQFVFSNFAVSTLSEAIAAGDNTLHLNSDDVWRFPELTGGARFPLVLADQDENVEIIYVTSLSASGLASIERGREGTQAQPWLAGTLLRHTFTAASVIGAAGLRPRGDWNPTSSYSPNDVVVYLGVSYIATIASLGSVPSGSNSNWQLIYSPPGAASTAMNAQGRWGNSITYNAGAVVEYQGRQWQSNANANLNNAPAVGSSYWSHFSPWSGAGKHETVLAFAGTNNYTVSIAGAEAPQSLYDGLTVKGRFANSNTGNATLTINALAPTPLRLRTGLEMGAGDIVAGELYTFTYVSATSEFIVFRMPGLATLQASMMLALNAAIAAVAAGNIPVGTVSDFAGAAAPTGWLLCYGQAVSRTTYSVLFGVIGTQFGAGDGTTTFNVPDLRGRVTAGLDSMGGAAAGRLTGYLLGTVGGAQTHTLGVTEIPGHTHTVSDPGHTHTATDSGHSHGYGDFQSPNTSSSGTAGVAVAQYGSDIARTTSPASANITVQNATTGIALFNTGGGLAHNNIQPTMGLNKIIFAGA